MDNILAHHSHESNYLSVTLLQHYSLPKYHRRNIWNTTRPKVEVTKKSELSPFVRRAFFYRFFPTVVVTLRIIYVIHSANIGEPCRKAFA